MTYTSQHIANYFFRRSKEEGKPLTMLKLVYIAYGWVIALTGEKLFGDKIEAWLHDPVTLLLYHEFKHFGKSAIDERSVILNLDSFDHVEPEVLSKDTETLQTLDKVWQGYGQFSGWDLRNKTHAHGTPWEKVYDDAERNMTIPDDSIAEHGFGAWICPIVIRSP